MNCEIACIIYDFWILTAFSVVGIELRPVKMEPHYPAVHTSMLESTFNL